MSYYDSNGDLDPHSDSGVGFGLDSDSRFWQIRLVPTFDNILVEATPVHKLHRCRSQAQVDAGGLGGFYR